MTNFGLEDIEFWMDFLNFEKNRMYPPDHERKPMVTINDRHIAAVARAETFMLQGITSAMSERHQKHVNNDILCLKEVRKVLRLLITEPTFPFVPDPVKPKEKVVSNGNSSTSAAS